MSNGNYEYTHAKLLQCGRDAFRSEGFEKANVRRISHAAGVTTGAFYKHFADKEALFAELVEPVAAMIRDSYQHGEEKGFATYGEDFPITPEQITQALRDKAQGTLETVSALYEHKESFELLMFHAYGTSYAGFMRLLVERENQDTLRVMELIHGAGRAEQIISKASLNIINQAFFSALSNAIVQARDRAALLETTKVISTFFNSGWEVYRKR